MHLRIVLQLIIISVACISKAQAPIAEFDFDKKKLAEGKVGPREKIVGASFTNDRFGNENQAIYVFGNEFSYVSLGADKKLKNRAGSISFWVNIESEVWSGTGVESNPLMIAKRSLDNNFYETFGVYYMLNTKKVAVCFVRDSLRQINITSMKSFSMLKWHHLVITYDDKFFAFYVDGILEKKIVKNFPSLFLEDSPILMGVTNNTKNQRFTQAAFDDVKFYDFPISDQDVVTLYKAANPNQFKIWLNRLITLLLVLCGIYIVYVIVRHSLSISHKREKRQLQLQKKILETDLRVNRALMNPHFVYNSMNALQNFILKNENENANEYLVKFSKLMRRMLESNLEDSITLSVEIDMISRYLEIENMRFDENIIFSIEVDPEIKPSVLRIPVMMLQPFVENAIWHGLLKKKGDKFLTINFQKQNRYLLCTINDNGVGRGHSKMDPEKKSLGTGFVEQRLKLLNTLHGVNSYLDIYDKPNGGGTLVTLFLPILNTMLYGISGNYN